MIYAYGCLTFNGNGLFEVRRLHPALHVPDTSDKMTHMASIRKMQTSDAEAVCELWDRAATEIHGGSLSAAEAANVLALLKRYPEHPDTYCLIAEEEGQIVGYILAYTTKHPLYDDSHGVGEVENCYVESTARQRGADAQLVQQLTFEMRQRGISVIHAHGSIDSQAAQDFWQDLGWYKDTIMFSWYAFLHEGN